MIIHLTIHLYIPQQLRLKQIDRYHLTVMLIPLQHSPSGCDQKFPVQHKGQTIRRVLLTKVLSAQALTLLKFRASPTQFREPFS